MFRAYFAWVLAVGLLLGPSAFSQGIGAEHFKDVGRYEPDNECVYDSDVGGETYLVREHSGCTVELESERPIRVIVRGFEYLNEDFSISRNTEFKIVVDKVEYRRNRFLEGSSSIWLAPGKHRVKITVGDAEKRSPEIQVEFSSNYFYGVVGDSCTYHGREPGELVRGKLTRERGSIQTEKGKEYSGWCG